MRIALSGMFWTEPHVGSGQYLHNLIAQYIARPSAHKYILIIPRYLKPQRPSLPHVQTVLMPTPFDGRNNNLAKVWFEQVALNQAARALRADLVHVPYFGAPRRIALPTIVTVHDLIPILLPEYRGGRSVQMYMRLATSSARRATAIIADSEHTRRDIVERLKVDPQRIDVTYLAAASSLQPQPIETIAAMRDRFRLADPYICYLGGFDARKNVATVLRAFARARSHFDRRVSLVIAGRLPTTTSELFPDMHRAILDQGIADDVIVLGQVSDADKAALMSGCKAFVYPSLYEGFGLQPIEAMQCGAAVLASSTTSVGEVVGDGGVQLPPDDVDAWAAALVRVVADGAWREQLRARGLERARHFSWAETARQTVAIYERVAA